MKISVIARLENTLSYVFADMTNSHLLKWAKRLFWVGVHGMTLFFIVSALLSIAPVTSAISAPSTKATVVKSAVTFPVHENAPDPNKILELVNAQRQAAGLSPLRAEALLSGLAESRASDMIGRSYYAHKNPDGLIFYDLLGLEGYSPTFACENLSLEASNSIEVSVNSWLMSTRGHRECLLNADITSAGYAAIKMNEAHINGSIQSYYVVVAVHSTEL